MQSSVQALTRETNNDVLTTTLEEKNRESLEAAFLYFNETSEQLSRSYLMLEKRVQQLTGELDLAKEEKQQENQKKNQIATRMQALLDFLPGGVIVLDSKGYIVESNPAARKLLDHKLDGQLWRIVIGDCFAPKNDDGLEVSTKSGRRISISTSSLENNGQIILLTDQTDTRKLQANLNRHERLSAMGKMVSALAHQIRTPLSAAILYAGHLTKDNIDENKKAGFSKKILSRLLHMEKQVRDMMLFVKNELPLNDIVSLRDLGIGLKEASEVAIKTSKAQCRWHGFEKNIRVKCHREALISALMNLVNNGIQASEEPVQIDIFTRYREDQDKITIGVRDYGAGMNAAQLAATADMFFTTKAQGTGLGLAVVQSVVRAHGGHFDLSSSEGNGSLAVIDLPIHDLHR